MFVLTSMSFAQTPVYVDAARPDDTGDGLSWVTAKKTIQAGVSLVAASGTVNVAAGTYGVGATFKTSGVTAVEDKEVIPTQFELSQNYPNPFNPTTKIAYSLPQNSYVSIKVYDMLGREVKTLANTEMLAGNHSVDWNGDDNSGIKVASGAYIYKITASNFVAVKKMILIK